MIGTVDTNTVDPVSRVGNNPGRKGVNRWYVRVQPRLLVFKAVLSTSRESAFLNTKA